MHKPFRRIFIEITNHCNLTCGFCAHSARPKISMTPRFFEHALNQAAPLAGQLSLHVLGEPFTHPDFPRLLALCSERGVKINLVTNGTLLCRFGADLFRAPCLRQVSISLHALGGLAPGAREAALADIIRFCKTRSEKIIASLRLRGDQAGEFEQAVKTRFFSEFGISEPKFERGAVKLAAGVYFNTGGLFDWPGTANANTRKQACLGLRHNCAILSDGRVTPCCADFDGHMTLGTIAQTPLADIVNSPAAQALRAALASAETLPPFCRGCGFAAPR